MKKLLILLFVNSCFLFSNAQKDGPVDLKMDRKEIEGYVIQIRVVPGGTFLFDILKNGFPVYRQTRNPFTIQAEGFEKRIDALNIGEWLIREFKNPEKFPTSIPPHVADRYKIRIKRAGIDNQN